MFKKIFLPTILAILVYGFWISPEFKTISAGVAIFLFGMMFLEQGFKAFTGGTLEKVLQKTTDKTWKSLLFGFTSATIMQSSSLVSLLAISFLSAELISLIQGIGIIFGANIGTTTGAWLIAAFGMKINISLYAMPMLVFGVILSFQKTKVLKGFGSILAGLGFLFLGIHYMKEGFQAFQSSIQLIDYAMEGFVGILAFVGIGILATIIMQSSHATIILVIAALATGQVTYENALALIIGANIGTTITAILGSLTANINGKRLAISDVLFKLTTGVIFIIFLPFISDFVNILGNILGINSENYTLKLALFHTLFNVLGLIIVIPFMGTLINTVMKIFPDNSDKDVNKSLYLNSAVLDFPDTSLISIVKETKNLYEKSSNLILESLGLSIDDILLIDKKEDLIKKVKIIEIEELEKLYDFKIKGLYSEIIDFIANSEVNNSKKYHNRFYKLKNVNIKIVENIKYIEQLHKNLSKYTKSTNENIKNEYQNTIFEIIKLIKNIYNLSILKDEKEKLILISEIEININKNDSDTNYNIDNMIRGDLITNKMASSLINDTYHKNIIFKNLLEISQIIFNNSISEDILQNNNLKDKKIDRVFNNIFGLSNKKLEKSIQKLVTKKHNLKQKMKKTKDKVLKDEIKKEIEVIDYTLNKYN